MRTQVKNIEKLITKNRAIELMEALCGNTENL